MRVNARALIAIRLVLHLLNFCVAKVQHFQIAETANVNGRDERVESATAEHLHFLLNFCSCSLSFAFAAQIRQMSREFANCCKLTGNVKQDSVKPSRKTFPADLLSVANAEFTQAFAHSWLCMYRSEFCIF